MSFAVSAIQVLKDCTDNHYLVRQLFLETFLKENISVFSQFCFTTELYRIIIDYNLYPDFHERFKIN